MKKRIYNIAFFIMLILSAFWIIRGYYLGKTSYKSEKESSFRGRIIRIHKNTDEKFVKIFLANGHEYMPPFFEFKNFIKEGDSIYKKANTLEYIIYKNGNPMDSLIFQGRNRIFDELGQKK